MAKFFFGALAVVCFGLGTAGMVVPMLPTVPFYLLTVCFAARSSSKLHARLVRTRFYRQHLDEFVQHRSMTMRRKLMVMALAGGSMLLSMVVINHVAMYIVVPILLAFKAWYFFARVGTIHNA
ncbi:MAG: YbaN family protein [Oscillospiraceae bacterium]|nr:YbaN family protein [Oscillospiraceae bacterium]